MKRFFEMSKLERQKLIISGSLFFFIIASYSITKELQSVVFGNIVGIVHAPIAKILTVVILLPFIFVDGFLVDRLKRYQVFLLYLTTFSLIGFILNLFLGVPEIGLMNEKRDTSRFIGWIFYMYVEGYMVFIVGVFWAFINSIHKPKDAEHTYGFIVGCSKIGGMCSAIFAYLMFSGALMNQLDDPGKVRLALFISSTFLAIAAILVYLVCKTIDPHVLAGYHVNINERVKKTGVMQGLKVIFKQPYVIGIFGLMFCCDTLVEVVNYQRLLVVVADKGGQHSEVTRSIGQVASTLYSHIIIMQITGLALSIFVTNGLMRFLGTRIALFATPVLASLLMATYFITEYDAIIIGLYIALHALSYSVNAPIRESLYIVTSRDIQLKSKFIADTIGLKASRATGHVFNLMISRMFINAQPHLIILANNIFFVAILSSWFVVTAIVGSRYAKAKRDDEVIG